MLETHKKSEVISLMQRHGFHLSKALGQNLLVDKNIIDIIVAAADIGKDDTVVEIGPGLGALTVSLAQKARRVVAVEIDKAVIPLLEEVLFGSDVESSAGAGAVAGVGATVEIVNQDFMKYDVSSLPAEYKLLGNLPYYITTPIIMSLLEGDFAPAVMVLMVQKEVAQRLTAEAGSKEYGAISVATQYRCKAEIVADVSRHVFLPEPEVDSAVIRLTPGESGWPRAEDEKRMRALVRAGFSQRRKMMRNSLLKAGFDRAQLDAAFERTGISPQARAETLSAGKFVELSDALG
jgi:16S rRNA (adenine1518-N6/adenine1519-N6)-dimethyltransferase